MESSLPVHSDTWITDSLKKGADMDRAIRSLYEQHFESLSRYIVQNSGTEQDAEDVFQEVIVLFIRLVQENKFKGESSVKTFLYALNRNIWLNELKRKNRQARREEKFEERMGSTDPSLQHLVEDRERHQLIMRTMDALGENCKKILLLYYYENRSMREIVEHMHYDNEQVVRNKKYKCLKKLEAMLKVKPELFRQLKNFFHG
jgi:RNA polymerase sigma factor (sigma-70 family)